MKWLHHIALSNRLLATTQTLSGTTTRTRGDVYRSHLTAGKTDGPSPNLTWEKGELGVVLPDEFSPKLPLTHQGQYDTG